MSYAIGAFVLLCIGIIVNGFRCQCGRWFSVTVTDDEFGYTRRCPCGWSLRFDWRQ